MDLFLRLYSGIAVVSTMLAHNNIFRSLDWSLVTWLSCRALDLLVTVSIFLQVWCVTLGRLQSRSFFLMILEHGITPQWKKSLHRIICRYRSSSAMLWCRRHVIRSFLTRVQQLVVFFVHCFPTNDMKSVYVSHSEIENCRRFSICFFIRPSIL